MVLVIEGRKVVVGNDDVLTPGFVCVAETGLIASVTAENPFGEENASYELLRAELVCPGFIDIHNHGFSEETEDENLKVHGYNTSTLPKYGTTSILSTITFPKDTSKANHSVDAVENIAGKVVDNRTVVEGIFAEGPWVSDYGSHVYSNEDFNMAEFITMISRMPSCKMLALSPSAEDQCSYQRLCYALEKGIVPALGHDRRATEEQIITTLHHYSQIEKNPHKIRPHITHLFNVCTFNHRLPSLVNFGLVKEFPDLPELLGLEVPTVDIVMDMEHVSSLTIAAALQCRSYKNVAAITDAVMDYDMEVGTVRNIKNGTVELIRREGGGKVVASQETKTLAGSCTNQLRIFHSLVNKLKVPLEEAVCMLSSTPARIARLDHKVGYLSKGKRADILLFNQKMDLLHTIINGKIVFSATTNQ